MSYEATPGNTGLDRFLKKPVLYNTAGSKQKGEVKDVSSLSWDTGRQDALYLLLSQRSQMKVLRR